ncbi:MAG: hypothetical protein JWO78_1027 [Micavibrio sp.]|nr:hypothetical protein [Micavibrio sp.]
MKTQLRTKFALFAAGSVLAAAAQAETFFPAAGDFLAAQGYDPAIVAEVAGPHVRVRVMTPEGLLRLRDRIPADTKNRAALVRSLEELSEYGGGSMKNFGEIVSPDYNVPDDIISGNAADCYILPVGSKETVTGMLHNMGVFTEAAITSPGMDKRQMDLFQTVHEMRHCHAVESGDASEYKNEDAADWFGVKIISRVFNDPALALPIIYARSGNVGQYHTALYVDAMRRGEAPPAKEDVRTAQEFVFALGRKYQVSAESGPVHEWRYQQMKRVAEDGNNHLSGLQSRVVQLYIDAYQALTRPQP